MSSTTECLAGYIWFTSVDNHISQCISRVYAHDLQLQWLEDLQPQLLAKNMNSILQDIETQEEMSIQYYENVQISHPINSTPLNSLIKEYPARHQITVSHALYARQLVDHMT